MEISTGFATGQLSRGFTVYTCTEDFSVYSRILRLPNGHVTNPQWQALFRETADPRRAEVAFGNLPAAKVKSFTKGDGQILATVLGGSAIIPNWLATDPELLEVFDAEALKSPRKLAGLKRELAGLLKSLSGNEALDAVRRFKVREMTRIAARDLARLGDVAEVTAELAQVADVTLSAMLEVCQTQISQRFGVPWHQDENGRWRETPYSLIGLGKLGGEELNYSSDVDVMLIYGDEGQTFKAKPRGSNAKGLIASHDYFNQLTEEFIAAVGGATEEGMLYRIDFRLRPEGDAGPLARSLASCENYYAQWGELWERLMLIKARPIAGDAELGAEFIEMTQPFRYPRSLSEAALSEMGALKRLIEEQVVREGELHRNVKLGRGGIREVEFIVQTLQLLHAGRQPFLQNSQTLPTLPRLAQYGHLPEADADALTEAYRFLRDVEHRLQMEHNLQTHTVPEDRASRTRLARLMGFTNAGTFNRTMTKHMTRVRRVFDQVQRTEASEVTRVLPEEISGQEEAWEEILTTHGFRDIDQALPHLREFIEGPEHTHVPAHTSRIALDLTRTLLSHCPQVYHGKKVFPISPLSDPDRVLTRLDSFISAYGSRGMLYETWFANRALFELLLLTFDRSEFLAETAIQSPDLIDELEVTGQLNRRKNADRILTEMQYGSDDSDQSLWLRKYFRAEQMRIGLRDTLEINDTETTLDELSALADACLRYAMEVIQRRHRLKKPPFSIIGLGKLGGREVNFGSDLDILFITPGKARNLERAATLAAELISLLSERTDAGMTWETDTRLRPEGRDGLLVNDLAAHEHYYRTRGELWEIQTLSRARYIAGDEKAGYAFENLARRLSNLKSPDLPLAAFSKDWKKKIHEMRRITEVERTPAGLEDLAIKTGAGGLMDTEFIAQTLCLAEGWHEPNTRRALERAGQSRLITKKDASVLAENYSSLQRLELTLRRWSYEGETVLPEDEEAQYRVAIRSGLPSGGKLLSRVAKWQKSTRTIYRRFFKAKN